MNYNEKGQAVAPKAQYFGKEAFEEADSTIIRWLGNGGAFINSRGTTIMIDPLLQDFDMPLLVDMPITVNDIPHLDVVLLTHCDNDHFSRSTCRDLKNKCNEFHGPHYVAELLEEEGIKGNGHTIYESFAINDIQVSLTAADHAWQNEREKYSKLRFYKNEDFCGYWIETKDGTIWMPGDSRLLPEQLKMPVPDVILFDFSDSSWHIGLDGAKQLADAYPNTPLILIHWGCVDAPTMAEFNGDPNVLKEMIVNLERVKVLAPGESFMLNN